MEVHFNLFGADFVLKVNDDELSQKLSEVSNAINVFHVCLPHRFREIDDFAIALIRELLFMYETKNKDK